MDLKPSNDTTAEKGKQNMLLVVLLILVAAFAYLYFFTGLIKPQEAQKPTEAPAPQVVKMPLPPHDGKSDAAAPADSTAGAPGARKNAVAPAKPEPRKVAETEAPEEPKKPMPAKPSKAASILPACGADHLRHGHGPCHHGQRQPGGGLRHQIDRHRCRRQ